MNPSAGRPRAGGAGEEDEMVTGIDFKPRIIAFLCHW